MVTGIESARRFVMAHSTEYPAVRGKLLSWPKWKRVAWRQSWEVIHKHRTAKPLGAV